MIVKASNLNDGKLFKLFNTTNCTIILKKKITLDTIIKWRVIHFYLTFRASANVDEIWNLFE